jgi:hypothetical protein
MVGRPLLPESESRHGTTPHAGRRSGRRSELDPDRYLRHSDYFLRIDPISASSATVDRQDATFQLVS